MINIQNDDDGEDDDDDDLDQELAGQIYFKGIKFPIQKKYYEIIEKKNIIIKVFGYEKKNPYCIYKNCKTPADLLLISNVRNSDYVLVKDFNRFYD